jgi:hypothetical protein
MAMQYADWLTAATTILQVADTAGVAAFSNVAPRCIEYAELRIYRQFDFLATRNVDISQRTTAAIRSVPIPSAMLIVDGVSLILPANTASPSSGQRVPLLRTSRGFLDLIWPIEAQTQTPAAWQTYYAIYGEQESSPADPSEPTPIPSSILIAPTPDDVYTAEFTGVVRPAPLSPDNSATVLTALVPDLFLCATLIWGFGWQRDFGAQSSDPAAAMSWEAQYKVLAEGIDSEELRKKSASVGWSSQIPTPLANMSRTALPPAPPSP